SFGDPAHLAGYGWYYSGVDVRRGTIITDITVSTYQLRTGSDAIYDTYSVTGDTERVYLTNGYARVVMWR
ncbi:MAG: hypothetical protein GY869_16285, partial [Planctomycetes bacterium]|nr:hypothetical protein [Planctomycetota bacterium]